MRATVPRVRRPARLLSRVEELELAKLAESGDGAAREHLILANQGLIGHLLRKEFRGFIYLWDDLFQEGQVGLIKAVDKFDWRRNCRFSSYAVWWIRREIQLALGRWWTGAARLPEARLKELGEFRLATAKLESRLDRHPNPEEIAGEMGVPLEKVYDLLRMMAASRRLVSLDAPDGEGRCVLNLLADDGATALEDESGTHLQRHLRGVIKVALTPKQRDVICLRYGIDLDGEYRRPLPQKDVAEQMSISAQAVSRLEERALARIKAEMDAMMSPFRRID